MKTSTNELGDSTSFNQGLLAFLAESPTPFHAAQSLIKRLAAAGYTELKESDTWDLEPGARHYVVRGGSSVVALRLATGDRVEEGFRMVGAHTDSPCLKVKPSPEIESCGLTKLGVEIYGGVLLSTWFDRDLSLAGRVSYLGGGGEIRSHLVDFGRAVAVVPNLAIHLNREVNEHRSINKQIEMPPIVCRGGDRFDLKAELKAELERVGVKDVDRVLDYDLCFYDVQPPARVGWRGEFLSSARLDNLLSCYAGLQGFLQDARRASAVLVCNDHEEVGSASAVGAQGPFLRGILERLCGGSEEFSRAVARSLFVSTDNAHAVHPNYPEKHDAKHAPMLNHGPALKVNANQRYATTSETAAVLTRCCELADVPLQKFVARADMGCGSTIGPITATVLGVRTVDIGVPTFAMHSARELAGTKDAHALARALGEFFRLESLPE